MAKSAKHSSKSRVGWPKVRNIRENQGSDGQKCETFVKIRVRMAKSVKHSSKSRVGDQKLTTVSHFGAKGPWAALVSLGGPWPALAGLISDLVLHYR